MNEVPTHATVVVVSGALLLLAAIGGFVYVWKITLDTINDQARETHRAILVRIMMSGSPIRSIAIVVIVVIVGYLAFFGRLNPEATTSILAGRAGYVLGGVGRPHDLHSPVGEHAQNGQPKDEERGRPHHGQGAIFGSSERPNGQA
jgi:hypothetical protein